MSSISSGGGSSVGDIFSKLFPEGGGGLTADPLFRLGMGLLARSGPADRPHTFGQDLAGAFGDLEKAQRQDISDESNRLQLGDYKSDLERKKTSIQKAEEFYREQQKLNREAMGGTGAQITQSPLTPPGLGPQQMPVSPVAPSMTGVFTSEPSPQGLSPHYFDHLGFYESGRKHGPEAYDAQGKFARGKYQFTPLTYKDYADDPTDWSPPMQERTVRKFTSANTGTLQLNQLPVNDVNAYAMHLLGQGGGPRALRAGDNALVQDAVSAAAIRENPDIFTPNVRTVGDMKSRIAETVFGQTPPAAMAQPQMPGAGMAPGAPGAFSFPNAFPSPSPLSPPPSPAGRPSLPSILGGQTPFGAPGPPPGPGPMGDAGLSPDMLGGLGIPGGPSGIELFGAMQSIPKTTLQKIYPLAYAAAGGDPLVAMQLTGQTALKLLDERERRLTALAAKDPNEWIGQPFTGRVGDKDVTMVRTRKGMINLTELMDFQRTSLSGGRSYDLDNLSTDDKDLIDYQTEQYRKFGTLPTGRTMEGLRKAVMTNAARQAKTEGNKPIFDIMTRFALKADAISLNYITKQADAVHQFEGTLLRNMKRVEDIMPQGGIGNLAPLLNEYVQWGKEKVLADPEVPEWNAALITVIDEYAKILSGSVGNTPVSDAARLQASKMLRPDMTKAQVLNVFDTIRADSANRQQSVLATKDMILSRMQEKGAAGSIEELKKANEAGVEAPAAPVVAPSAPTPEVDPAAPPPKPGYGPPVKSLKSGKYIHRNLTTGKMETYD